MRKAVAVLGSLFVLGVGSDAWGQIIQIDANTSDVGPTAFHARAARHGRSHARHSLFKSKAKAHTVIVTMGPNGGDYCVDGLANGGPLNCSDGTVRVTLSANQANTLDLDKKAQVFTIVPCDDTLCSPSKPVTHR